MSADLSEMSAHQSETMDYRGNTDHVEKHKENHGLRTTHAENAKKTTGFSIGTDHEKI